MTKLILCRMLLFSRFFLVATMLLAKFTSAVEAQGTVSNLDIVASGAQLLQNNVKAHLELQFSGPVVARAFLMENPDRVIVDLQQVSFTGDSPNIKRGRNMAGAPLIRSFRYGLFAAGQSRIVMGLGSPAKILGSRVVPDVDTPNGAKLVLDLEKTDRAAFHTAVLASIKPEDAAPVLKPTQQPAAPFANEDLRPLIVIDPGHGGPDSGAIGLEGVVEKDIVSKFANVLKARLEASGHYRVLLTRQQDVFVPLGERMRIARAANANLFLSIHADTLSGSGSVAGATIYTVSDKASDAEAARIAANENAADQAGGLAIADQPAEVADILVDLTRRETRAYAHVFSKSLVAAWKSGPFLSLNKNPQRSAGFVVLKAPDVPSVLLELGYLSSRSDVKALISDEWRDHASASVAQAIDSFFAPRPVAKKAEILPQDSMDMAITASIIPAENATKDSKTVVKSTQSSHIRWFGAH